jgi:hypothetical protein
VITQLRLPGRDGTLVPFTPSTTPALRAPNASPRLRVAYAAAHVVCDPTTNYDPLGKVPIDWDATIAYRRHLWSLGFGVAEAMDTAQRGMGLDAAGAFELIEHSLDAARSAGGAIACGAGTDQLDPERRHDLSAIEDAYLEQCRFIESRGGRVILMASRALAAAAGGPDDYARIYSAVLGSLERPAILHWLGPMFDPKLAGYWGSADLDRAAETALAIVIDNAAKVDGLKMSLLDKAREVAFRQRLPKGVRMYTGDDFHYPELIRGDASGYSDALLGIFDAIALPAACALEALDGGDLERYDAIFAPTVPLARHVFAAPTSSYKTGIVFLAYLNGHQRHFRMLGGAESARSVLHLAELFRLADAAGVLLDRELAAERMTLALRLAGIA